MNPKFLPPVPQIVVKPHFQHLLLLQGSPCSRLRDENIIIKSHMIREIKACISQYKIAAHGFNDVNKMLGKGMVSRED